MTTMHTPTVDQYWEALRAALPAFSPEDQRAAVALYRKLAQGRPLEVGDVAEALAVSVDEARSLLERPSLKAFVYADDQGRVVGFGGLAAAPMHHRFTVNGRTLWTWCAWDSLFIPEILGETAHVESPDPGTGELVRLTVSPTRVEAVEPRGAVVSFLLPDARDFDTTAANVVAKFCHFVFFFASQGSGERWVARHPGTFLYSVDDAFALAKQLNAQNFGPALPRY
jgi:alkylmercury lyase